MHNTTTKRQNIVDWLKDTKQFPNALTLLRVALFWAPAALIIDRQPLPALFAFTLIVLTDIADGKLARKWGQVSDFGKLWDPIADKALTIATLVALGSVQALPFPLLFWAFVVFTIGRELMVSVLRWLKARGGRKLVIPANADGKLKMVAISVGIVAACFGMILPPFQGIAAAAFTTSVYYSLRSAVAYIKA